jgi:hypothetical protein
VREMNKEVEGSVMRSLLLFCIVLLFWRRGACSEGNKATCNKNKHVVASTQEKYEVISNVSACNHTRGYSERVRDRKRREKRKSTLG